jgi:cell division control protein 6
LSRFGVFRNRGALLHDYTPPRLPHRERELADLKRRFKPVLHEDVNVKVHVYGRIGTGKTVLCNRLGEDLMREASEMGKKLKYVNINLAYTPKPYHVMSRLMQGVMGASGQGLSPEDMLAQVVEALKGEDCKLILALDEVDTYINEGRDPKIFYMLPRVHELDPGAAGRISLIYISRSLEWMGRLDAATLDTLGRTAAVQLEEYGAPEVRDITGYRAEEAFFPGAVPEEIIDFIAEISTDYGGVRYALELLLEAGSLAEGEGASAVKAEHVRNAHASIPKGTNGPIYPGMLSLHKQLLLKAIIDGLQARGDPYLNFEDVYSSYAAMCEWNMREAEDEHTIKTYLEDLSLEGYILLSVRNGEYRVGMEYPFERLAKLLEEALREALSRP